MMKFYLMIRCLPQLANPVLQRYSCRGNGTISGHLLRYLWYKTRAGYPRPVSAHSIHKTTQLEKSCLCIHQWVRRLIIHHCLCVYTAYIRSLSGCHHSDHHAEPCSSPNCHPQATPTSSRCSRYGGFCPGCWVRRTPTSRCLLR